jgi:hypothetical protein
VTSPASPYRFEKNRGVIVFLCSLKQLGVARIVVGHARIRAAALWGL